MGQAGRVAPVRVLAYAFALLCTVVAVQAAVVTLSARAERESHAWERHTYEVIVLADRVLAALVDMETGYRGFLLTGQDLYLEPYTGGIGAYQVALAELRQQTADNPDQLRRWDDLET